MPDIPKVEGELKLVDGDDWVKAADQLQEARELVKSASELVDVSKERLQELMGDDEAIEIPGLVRIYWRWGKPGTKWKGTAEAMAQDNGLNLDDYKVPGKASRAFTPYFLKRAEG